MSAFLFWLISSSTATEADGSTGHLGADLGSGAGGEDHHHFYDHHHHHYHYDLITWRRRVSEATQPQLGRWRGRTRSFRHLQY